MPEAFLVMLRAGLKKKEKEGWKKQPDKQTHE
jgi:hypothetical protein